MITLRPGAIEKERAAQFVSISVSTLEKLQREGQFPRPRLLSDKRVGYLVRELEEWLESRPVSEQLPPPNTGALKPRRRRRPGSPANDPPAG